MFWLTTLWSYNMKKLYTLLFILATTQLALAAGIPEKHPTDTFQIGVGTSAAQKNFVFDLGLGGSNPVLGVDTVLSGLNYSKNLFQFGDGLSSQKSFIANVGLGSTNPKIIWNSTNGDWEFSNDGTNFTSIGSGSGGSSGVNLLDNPGFESGITLDWTNTGGTFSSVNSGPNLLIGKRSATFTASAGGQSVQSGLHAVPNGLKSQPCAVSMMYLGGDTNLTFEALDNSSNILASQIVQPASTPTVVTLPFLCPASGSVREKVFSTGAASLIAMDQMFLGQNALIQVNQAQLIGAVVISGCSAPFSTNNASFVSYSAGTGCVYTTVGQALAPLTNIPAIRFASLPPGEYKLEYEGFLGNDTTAGAGYFKFSDGTNISREISTYSGANSSVGGTGISQSINYGSAQSNVTLNILAAAAAGVGNTVLYGTNTNPGTIRVYYYPTQSQIAVRPDLINWVVDALTSDSGGAVPLTTGAVPAASDIQTSTLSLSPATGSLPALQPCATGPAVGSTCSGNESLGVAFNLPAAGDVMACAQFSHHLVAGSGFNPEDLFSLYETDANNSTQLQGGTYAADSGITAGTSTSGVRHSVHVCERLRFSSAGLKYLRLLYSQTTGGGITTSEISDGPPVHWIVKPITQNVPAPVLVNSVSTPSAGQEQVTRTLLNFSGTSNPTIASQSGTWLTGVTRNSVGNFTLHIAAGIFSDLPSCTSNNTSLAPAQIRVLAATNQSVNYFVTDGAGSLTDLTETNVPVICVGPK